MNDLICLTGPSGIGKTSYARRLCNLSKFNRTKILTTRAARSDDDSDFYSYVTEEEFLSCVDKGMFLEHDTYLNYRYGTLQESVQNSLHSGCSVVLDLTPSGVLQTLAIYPLAKVVILLPTNHDWLMKRLEERGSQGFEEIQRRQAICLDYIEQLSSIPGSRVIVDYDPNSWDSTFFEILNHIGVTAVA